MNLNSIKTIKELLLKYDICPSKTLGQNFLVNQKILGKIIKSANLNLSDMILEVGPGIGTLTQELAKQVKKVIAVEKDTRMVEILKETLKDFNNVEIVDKDVLKLSIFNYQLSNYKIVANIPYYLTSPLIRKFLEEKSTPVMIVLMIQKEVAQRICAKPPNMNLLAVSVQFYAEPKVISYVKKESFWPSPKVDSAIIKIVSKKRQETEVDVERFFKVVKAGFSQPRKQLVNNLSKILKGDRQAVELWLSQNKISPQQRAETLGIDDWISLTNSFTPVK